MNPSQIEIAEKILSYLKSKNNVENINNVWNTFNSVEQRDRYVIINSLKDDYKLIKPDGAVYFLTKKGIGFTSFNDIFEEEKKLENKNKLDYEKSIIDLKLNKWLIKTKWIPHIISILSLLFAVYVYFDSKNENNDLKNKINILEKKLNTIEINGNKTNKK